MIVIGKASFGMESAFIGGMTLPLTKADQARWDSIQGAFLQAVERESGKTTQDRVMEQTKAPFYFLKGAAKASLKLLEKGINEGIALWQDQATAVQSPKKYLAAKQAEQQTLQTIIKNAAQNPRKFLSQNSEELKDQITQKAIEFLTSSKERQAEMAGEMAPGVALTFLEGDLAQGPRRSLPLWSSTKKITPLENAFNHWIKHKTNFPEIKNAKQYVETTMKFVKNPPKESLIKIRPSGDTMIYHPASNTLAITSKEGIPRTMFKPSPSVHGYPTNLNYFYEQ